jgi:hypothetical protein
MFSHLRYVSLATGAIIVAGATAAYFVRSRRKSPSERERERREFLNRSGRIADGTLIDFTEVANPADPNTPVQLLLYQYEISGVQYDAAQDVTELSKYVNVHNCRLGLPASVRYAPLSPQNSMVVSESWSGLHTGAFATHATSPARRTQNELSPQPR